MGLTIVVDDASGVRTSQRPSALLSPSLPSSQPTPPHTHSHAPPSRPPTPQADLEAIASAIAEAAGISAEDAAGLVSVTIEGCCTLIVTIYGEDEEELAEVESRLDDAMGTAEEVCWPSPSPAESPPAMPICSPCLMHAPPPRQASDVLSDTGVGTVADDPTITGLTPPPPSPPPPPNPPAGPSPPPSPPFTPPPPPVPSPPPPTPPNPPPLPPPPRPPAPPGGYSPYPSPPEPPAPPPPDPPLPPAPPGGYSPPPPSPPPPPPPNPRPPPPSPPSFPPPPEITAIIQLEISGNDTISDDEIEALIEAAAEAMGIDASRITVGTADDGSPILLILEDVADDTPSSAEAAAALIAAIEDFADAIGGLANVTGTSLMPLPPPPPSPPPPPPPPPEGEESDDFGDIADTGANIESAQSTEDDDTDCGPVCGAMLTLGILGILGSCAIVYYLRRSKIFFDDAFAEGIMQPFKLMLVAVEKGSQRASSAFGVGGTADDTWEGEEATSNPPKKGSGVADVEAGGGGDAEPVSPAMSTEGLVRAQTVEKGRFGQAVEPSAMAEVQAEPVDVPPVSASKVHQDLSLDDLKTAATSEAPSRDSDDSGRRDHDDQTFAGYSGGVEPPPAVVEEVEVEAAEDDPYVDNYDEYDPEHGEADVPIDGAGYSATSSAKAEADREADAMWPDSSEQLKTSYNKKPAMHRL